MKALIIEDEEQAISALKSELKTHCKDVEITGEAQSIKDAIQKIKLLEPELIFLDIQLSDGLGFEILNQLDQHNLKVIFTTAYSQYAIKAIKFSALDYLLKPIDSEELVAAVNKAIKSSKDTERIKIQNFIQNEISLRKKIALHTSEGISIFETEKIVKLAAENNYTCIYFANGSKTLVSKTLKDFEDLLCSSGFERIHHSYIINLSHLVSFINKDGGYVILNDKSTLPVSQRKKAKLMNALINLG